MAIRGHALALGAALLFAPTVLASQASAATISVTKPCYVSALHKRAQMTVVGSGFHSGDSVTLSSTDGSVVGAGTASADGTISITTGAPNVFSTVGERTVTVTATDFSAAGPISASTPVNAAPLAVQTKPARAKFTSRVTWLFSGFASGKSIYAHYLHPNQVALTHFGKAKGPCGVLKTRALLFPGGHPHFKTYKVQFDDAKRFSKGASPKLDTTLRTFVV